MLRILEQEHIRVESARICHQTNDGRIHHPQHFLVHRDRDVPVLAHVAHAFGLDAIGSLEEENALGDCCRVLGHRPLLADHHVETRIQQVCGDKQAGIQIPALELAHKINGARHGRYVPCAASLSTSFTLLTS